MLIALKFSISSLFFASVIAAGSAPIGTPPELPIRFWISGFMVISMKSYASDLFFELLGMTQRLPPEPAFSLLPGKRNVPQSYLISSLKRPYHQEPEIRIGRCPG